MIPWTSIASVLLALAVGLGAFGAHALKDKLDSYYLGVYEKAVFYQFVHALGLLITPLVTSSNRVCWFFLVGILLFCGSLYLLVLTKVRIFGAITPFGGVCFILAWLLLAWDAWRA